MFPCEAAIYVKGLYYTGSSIPTMTTDHHEKMRDVKIIETIYEVVETGRKVSLV